MPPKAKTLENFSESERIKYNNFHSKIEMIEYFNARNFTVIFLDSGYTIYNCRHDRFKNCSIKSPYCKSVYGVGFIGEGEYNYSKNLEIVKVWRWMLHRCYFDIYAEKYPTYKNCTVCEEWHNFQSFARWHDENYYKIGGERMELDKDILVKGNKLYSPKTCVFVPQKINYIFCKSDASRGDCPIGVNCVESGQSVRYIARCNIQNGNRKWIGSFKSPEKAFDAYKKFKEHFIKLVADRYKSKIPKRLYEALYVYTVEITD